MFVPPAVIAAIVALGFSGAAQANEFAPQMRAELDARLSAWISAPVIVEAVRVQNATTATYDQARIDALDRTWRSEVGASQMPLIEPVINNDAARFLRDKIAQSDGRIVEAFVMDAKGLNVAASAPTSDYWQGDEAKFRNSFGKGAEGVDLGEVAFDESAQAYLAQISAPVIDPDTGAPIGAVTIGLNVDALP
ncbi:hypothetical protein U879_09185 [Defluviimonas sp. 20V17]|uniref:Methyl-accepting chemotaxis protein n=1 Tax=Allgaiera indica TaxID=765699 RepID=A0AAN4ZYJ8_9RHOB|nr:cache domain-containing protein [Allgaiera indica]KDB04012.1 hypothetical protein U879_09185 [Defluviimonas sp. 20V17]GHD99332.1 hypothetical protein GCM10008024_06290 [Allgaiera indica]SDW28640.1 hypothetical protein SAMN05444006_102246 [Allgaiera indica]